MLEFSREYCKTVNNIQEHSQINSTQNYKAGKIITKCGIFCDYKLGQVLQIGAVITKQSITPFPVDSSKLSNVAKNDDNKKTDYDELVKKVKDIKTTETSDLVKKADYDTKIGETEKKILDHNHENYITAQEFNKLI